MTEQETSYPNEVQRFYYEDLKWCGCGNPEEALAFMRDVMQVMEDGSTRDEPSDTPYADSAWAKRAAKLDTMLPGALGLSYLYMLCALDLTEHGGSVGGSWLTPYGEGILKVLREADIEQAMDDA